MKSTVLAVVAIFSTCFLLFASSACASEIAETYTLNVQEGVSSLVALIFAAISAAIASLTSLLLGNRKIDPELKQAIDLSIGGAVDLVERKLQQKVAEIENPQIESKFIAETVNTLIEKTPNILKKAKVDETLLKELIELKIIQRKTLK